MRVLIPNASSPKNLGDLAILEGVICELKNNFPSAKITVHSFDHKLHNLNVSKVSDSLYSYAIFSGSAGRGLIEKFFGRLFGFLKLMLVLVDLKLKLGGLLIKDRQIVEMLADYKDADMIAFCGGGYLRSQKGLSQSLNLLMVFYSFVVSFFFKNVKITAPVSFGPFAESWHYKIALWILRILDAVMVREEISYEALKSKGLNNIVLVPDSAFVYNHPAVVAKKEGNGAENCIIGFTIRNWLPTFRQTFLENAYVEALGKFARDYHYQIRPVIQVSSEYYGDLDLAVTKRISERLKSAGSKVLDIQKPTSLPQALETYANLDLLVGMRMHSTVFSALAGTPFVAVSYEYKTEGICRQLGMMDFVIKSENVDFSSLYALIKKLYNEKTRIEELLHQKVKTFVELSNHEWEKILKS